MLKLCISSSIQLIGFQTEQSLRQEVVKWMRSGEVNGKWTAKLHRHWDWNTTNGESKLVRKLGSKQ